MVSGILVSVLVNIFCILVLLILVLGLVLQRKNKNTNALYFAKLIFAVILFLCINILCDSFEGDESKTNLSYIFNYVDYIAVDLIVIAFTYYLFSLIEYAGSNKIKLKKVIIISCITRAILVTILTLLGKLFAIENGCYIEKELSYLPYVMSMVVMIEILIAISINKKCFTTRQFVVIIVYEVFPCIPLLIEIYINLYILTSIAMTLSVLLIYVLMQDTRIERAKMKNSILEEISKKDLLTDIGNRRAYYERLNKLQVDENVGIVFCDVNGLKYTNDHYGHAAGDALLKSFSSLFASHFGEDNVYRISGDEFVAIINNTNDEFAKMVDNFTIIVNNHKSISAVGFAYGIGSCVEHLIAEAEEKMYEDKKTKGFSRDSKRKVY